jgi:hypothetical protein
MVKCNLEEPSLLIQSHVFVVRTVYEDSARDKDGISLLLRLACFAWSRLGTNLALHLQANQVRLLRSSLLHCAYISVFGACERFHDETEVCAS